MSGIRDSLSAASSIPGMKVATAQIDANHWLLNFTNGTFDIATASPANIAATITSRSLSHSNSHGD
jgi:phage/plasmid-associated DNA primase